MLNEDQRYTIIPKGSCFLKDDKYLIFSHHAYRSGHSGTSLSKIYLYHIASNSFLDSLDNEVNNIRSIHPTKDDRGVYLGCGGNLILWRPSMLEDTLMAMFKAKDTVSAIDDPIQFYDISSGNPNRWMWDFGDGTTSIAQNPKHKYEKPGTYTISLKVWDDETSSVEEKTDYIRITGNFKAAFSVDVTRGHYPLTVQFNNESTGYIESYKWEFGDKRSSSEENPLHTYKEAGLYEPKLIVYDGYFYDTAYAEVPINVFYEEVEDVEFILERRLDNANETSWCVEDDSLGYLYSYYRSWKKNTQPLGWVWVTNTYVNTIDFNGRKNNIFEYEDEDSFYFHDRIVKLKNTFLLRFAKYYFGYTLRDRKFNEIGYEGWGSWNSYGIYSVISDDEYAVIEREYEDNPNETRFYIRNENFDIVWDTTYNDLKELIYLKKLVNGNYLFVQNDKFLFLDNQGNIINEVEYNEGSIFNESRYWRFNERIIPCLDNGFIFWKGVSVKKNDIWVEVPTILSYDENGNLRNKVEWDSSFTKITYGTRIDENKYIFTGQIDGCIALLFTDKLGRETSRLVFKGRGGYATGITKTKDGGYFLVGNNGGRVYIAKFNYLAPIDVPADSCIDDQVNQSIIYPNPATSQITLSLGEEFISEIEIDVIDYLGNVMRFPTSARLSPSEKSITINTSPLSPGVYFLRMRSGEKVEVRKFVVYR